MLPILLLLAVVGVYAQPPHDAFLAGINANSIYVADDEDISSLPSDIQALIGSSQFGGPVPYGQHGLPEEGGAGSGEDFADGRIFGVDFDPSELHDHDHGPSPSSGGGTDPAPSGSSSSDFDLSQYFSDSGGDDRNELGSDDEDDELFDLSQYFSGSGDGSDSAPSGGSGSDFDLSQYISGSGGGSDPAPSGGSGSDFDLSQYFSGSGGDDGYDLGSDDEDDESFDLSQFEIGGGSDAGTPTGSDDSDEYSGFDFSQFGLGAGGNDDDDAGDGDDAPGDSDYSPIDLSQYGIGGGGDRDDSDGAGFDLSQFGFGAGGVDDDAKDDVISDTDTDHPFIDLSQFGIGRSDDGDSDRPDDAGFYLSQFSFGADGDGSDAIDDDPADSGTDYEPFDLSQFGIASGGEGGRSDYTDDSSSDIGFSTSSGTSGTTSLVGLSQFGIYSDGSDSSDDDIPSAAGTYDDDSMFIDLSQFGIGSSGGSDDTGSDQFSYDPYLSAYESSATIREPISTHPNVQPTGRVPSRDQTPESEPAVPVPASSPPRQDVLGVDLSDFGINFPVSPEATKPIDTSPAVEYLTVSATSNQAPPIVPGGFDVIQTDVFDWQNIARETQPTDPVVQRWIS